MTQSNNDEMPLSTPTNQTTLIHTLPFVASITFASLMFSQAIYNAGLHLIPIMRGQFTFQSNIMLKTFLTAAGTSTFMFATMHIIGKNKNLILREERHMETNKVGIYALIVGGLILGAGMEVAGACPGTLPIQVGSGFFPNGLYTILGAVIGASLFSFLKPYLKKFQEYGDFTRGAKKIVAVGTTTNKVEDGNKKENDVDMMVKHFDDATNYNNKIQEYKHRYTVYQWTGYNHIVVRITFATLLFIVAIVTEVLSPRAGIISSNVKQEVLDELWSPFICGPMIGILQLPLMLSGGKHLGSTPAYITTFKFVFSIFPCMPKRMKIEKLTLDSIWEFLYVFTAGIITLIFAVFVLPPFSMLVNNNTSSFNRFPYDGSVDTTVVEQIIGGIFIVFGAKLASGCTSGHGISGMSHLRMKSFIAVASMFVGGIIVGFCRIFIFK